MSRSKAAHKREKARRHARQIEEGTRAPREHNKRSVSEWNSRKMVLKRPVLLSQIDRQLVRAVIDAVKKLT